MSSASATTNILPIFIIRIDIILHAPLAALTSYAAENENLGFNNSTMSGVASALQNGLIRGYNDTLHLKQECKSFTFLPVL